MKHKKWSTQYTAELNRLAEDHLEVLLALSLDSFNDGMKVGRHNALLGVSVGVVVGGIALCIAGFAYLKHKEQS